MDRAFHIPGTRITVGLDALLGLLPIGGDVLTGLVQSALVLVALSHYKVPRTVAARMMANVLIDTAVGAIPLVGDLFDVGFKANTRNVRLLEAYRHPDPLEAGQVGMPSSIPIDLTSIRFRPPWPHHRAGRRGPARRPRAPAHRLRHGRPLVVPLLIPRTSIRFTSAS